MDVQELNKSCEWGEYVDEVLRLYREGSTLKRISAEMQDRYGLKKTERQYKVLFRKYRVKKNQTATTWATVSRRTRLRGGQGKRSEVFIDGVNIPKKKWVKKAKAHANDTHSFDEGSPSNDIIVRTPAADPPQGTDLESPAPEEKSTPRIDERCVAIVDAHISNPSHSVANTPSVQLADTDAISSLPEEYLDKEDLGNLEVLSRRFRQLLLRGVHVVQVSDNEIAQHSGETSVMRNKLISSIITLSKPSIHTSPQHSWSWESLSCILETLLHSKTLDARRLRRRLYRQPTTTEALARCSKVDLVSYTAEIILNDNYMSTMLDGPAQSLYTWMSHPHNRWFLDLLLSSPQDSPLVLGFALKIFNRLNHVLLWSYEQRKGISHLLGTIRVCFEYVSNEKHALSIHTINMLLEWAIVWRLLDYIPKLLGRGAKVESRTLVLAARFSKWQWDLSVATLPPPTVALLLRHGASIDLIWASAIETFIQRSQIGLDTNSQECLVCMCISGGIDTDLITSKTMPLSMAEHAALRCPALAQLLQPLTKDSTSREVINIYQLSFALPVMEDSSSLAKEIALLGLIWQENCDLNHLRILLEQGTDPHLPLLFQSADCDQAIGRNWGFRTSAETIRSKDCRHWGTATDRSRFGLHRDFPRPIDIACDRWDQDPTRLFLDFGSCPPRQILRSTPNEAQSRREQSNTHIWLAKLLYGRRIGKWPKAINFMRFITRYFLNSNHDVTIISENLLQWAIHDEDEDLLRHLFVNGVDLVRPRYFHVMRIQGFYCTPLVRALRESSLAFSKLLWGLDPRFSLPDGPSRGACELVSLCSGVPDDTILDKISFLLSLGVDVKATYAWGSDTPISPLQAALQGHYDRAHFQRGASNVERVSTVCDYFLREGADVDAIDSSDATPLQIAALIQEIIFIRLLLRNGADPNITRRTYKGQFLDTLSSPLSMICLLPACFCLDSFSLQLDSLPFPASRLIDRYEIVRLLLEAGADVDQRLRSNNTPLIDACLRGCRPTVQLLLQYGANARKQGHQGLRPIEASLQKYSMSSRGAEIAFALLEAGADVSQLGSLDCTLWESLRSRDFSLFKDRLEFLSRCEKLCGLDDDLDDYLDDYPLQQETVSVEAMIEAGVDVNYVKSTRSGPLTPLIATVERSDLTGVLCLLQSGADVAWGGQVALQEAISNDYCQIAQVLYNRGARPLWDEEGWRRTLDIAQEQNATVAPLIESWRCSKE